MSCRLTSRSEVKLFARPRARVAALAMEPAETPIEAVTSAVYVVGGALIPNLGVPGFDVEFREQDAAPYRRS